MMFYIKKEIICTFCEVVLLLAILASLNIALGEQEVELLHNRSLLHLAVQKGDLDWARLLVDTYKADLNAKTDSDAFEVTPLHIAAEFGHLPIVKYFLERQPYLIDVKDSVGRTPLHCAANEGNLEVVKVLLEKFNANAFERSHVEDMEDTPASLAAFNGHLNVVEYFLDKNPDLINVKDVDGNFLLHTAVIGGQVKVVDYLVSKKGVKVDLRQEKYNRTSLHLAAQFDDLDLVKLLFEKFKADPYARSNRKDDEDMPIHLAAFHGHLDVVKYFLDTLPHLIYAQDNRGSLPIHKAVLGGHSNVVEYLLSQPKAKVEERQVGTGRTSLHLAADQGNLDLVRLLVESYNAGFQSKSNRGDFGDLPIHDAAYFGHLPIVEYFLEKETTLTWVKDIEGNQPIHKATFGGRVNIADYLLSKSKVKVEQRQDSGGRTPLHCAAGEGHLAMVELLVGKYDADVFARSNGRDLESMPIHLAAQNGHLTVVEYLLERNSTLNEVKDDLGNRLIHRAAIGGKVKVVDFLLSKFKDEVDLGQDSSGHTPLHLAAQKGHLDVVKVLVEKFNANVFSKSHRDDWEDVPSNDAAFHGHLNVVKYLLERHPTLIDVKDIEGNGLIHKAVFGGRVDIVDYLLSEKGVKVEQRQESLGRTLLHDAAQQGRLEMVQLLVEKYNASVYAKSSNRDNRVMPIHLAAWQGRLDVVKYFVENHPDLVEVKDKNIMTPLQRALESGKMNEAPQVVAWLKLKMNQQKQRD